MGVETNPQPESQSAKEATDINEIKKAVEDLADASDQYPEEFYEWLQKEDPKLYSELKSLKEESPSDKDRNKLLQDLDVKLSDFEKSPQMVAQKVLDFVKNPYTKNAISLAGDFRRPEKNLLQMYSTADGVELRASGSPSPENADWYHYVTDVIKRVEQEGMTVTYREELILGDLTQFATISPSSSVEPEKKAPEKTAAQIREEARKNPESYKTNKTVNADGTETFTFTALTRQEELAIRIQDLVKNPIATPTATSSRYPGKTFNYDPLKKSYFDSDGQRMMIFNEDKITLSPSPEPVSTAVAEADKAPTEGFSMPVQNLLAKMDITYHAQAFFSGNEDFSLVGADKIIGDSFPGGRIQIIASNLDGNGKDITLSGKTWEELYKTAKKELPADRINVLA